MYSSLLLVLGIVSSYGFQPMSTTSCFISRHQQLLHDLNSALDNDSFMANKLMVIPSHREKVQFHSKSSLHMMSPAAAVSAVGSPIGSLAVLALVILVHEAGHFVTARSLGIDVDEFSVGVGPRILGLRKRKIGDGNSLTIVNEWITNKEIGENEFEKNDSIEFSLRVFPLGGYVRFPENYNRTLAYELEAAALEARVEARKMRMENSSPLEKVLEAAALSFILKSFSFGLLKKWVQKREEEQIRQAEEEVLLERKISRELSMSNGSFLGMRLPWKNEKNDIMKYDNITSKLEIIKASKRPEITYFDNPNLLQNRPWYQRAIVLSGGVVFNIILAFICYLGEFVGGKGLPMPVFDVGAVVRTIPSPASPSYGVLKQGDIILGVNDLMTYSSVKKQDMLASQAQISKVISSIRATPEGEPVKLTIIHGKKLEVPNDKEVVTVFPNRNDEGEASIGVMLGPNYIRTDVITASSLLDAISKAAYAVYNLTYLTASSLFTLFIDLLLGRGLPAGTSMSGPIGLVKSGAEVVSSNNFSAVVAFAASISINLAVVNSLPLPALDGGQLMFVLAEAAAGRKVDQRLQESINAGSLLILLFISFGTAIGDVTRIIFR